MIVRQVLLLTLLATSATAQLLDPVANVSGTAANPGSDPWVRTDSGGWTFFHGFDLHLTYLTQTGPEEQENMVFSTNWLAAGAYLPLGERGFVLARGRVSLEPYTIDDSYPQFFQYVSPEGGGPHIDRMRPNDLFGEAALQAGWRPTSGSLLHLYGALVGQPALGPPPAHLRSSGVDFAEAPFAYDIQEAYHDATSVVTGGLAMSWLAIEGSVFHDAVTTGDHTEIDSGDIDSRSARATLAFSSFAIQASRGELGEDDAQRTVTSLSASYGGPMTAVTALWTRREYETGRVPETAYGFEVALRGSRHTLMTRAEWVDRPEVFPFSGRATHFTAGYLFDFIAGSRYRAGAGVNIDYRTQTHDLEEIYGHKPQGIYAFVRLRTE